MPLLKNYLHGAVATLFLLAFAGCNLNKPNAEKHKESDKQYEMEQLMRQEVYMTLDPSLGYVPSERLNSAKVYMNQLIANRTSFRTNTINWQERGPDNIAGRVRAVLIDKRDASGNTLFSGGVAGGIWRCNNFKTAPNWTPLTDLHPNLAITCIYQDPTNLNVMYAGTGEGWFNSDAVRGNGIMKTTDGGVTWNFLPSTQFPATDDFDYIQDILVTSSGIVYATARSFRFCNRGGVLRSTDGGTSWTRVIGIFNPGGTTCSDAFNFRGADLEIATNGDLYATTGFQSSDTTLRGRIFRSPASLGAGQGSIENWTEITPDSSTWRRIEIAISPSNPNVIYALLQNGTNNSIGAIRRSDNAGTTWVNLPLPLWCDQGSTSTDFTRTQAWYDLIARVDPNNSNICYIGGVDILKTVDGGANWTQVTQWAQGCSGLPRVHADIHEIQFFGNSSTEMLTATDGGIYYSPNAGVAWGDRNANYRITQFYSVDYHPTITNSFLAGAQDNGTIRFQQAGVGIVTEVVGGDGAFCHIDQTDGLIQVASVTGNNYRYSRNGGISFAVVTGGSSASGRFINPTDYDDVFDVMYTAHSANNIGLVLDLAGTGTPNFNTISLTSTLAGRQVSAVKVDPNVSGGVVWMGTGVSQEGASSGTTIPILFKLSNANTLQPIVDRTVTLPLPAGTYVSSIDVEKGNPNHLLVTCTNYGVANSVIESVDGGLTWNNLEGNLPDMPIRWGLFAPSTAQLNGTTGGNGGIILGTQLGVWTTSLIAGASTSWIPNNTNFVNTRVDMVKYRESDNLLVAATHGRGLYTATIPTTVTAINPVINTKGFIQYISANNQQLFIKTGNLTTKNVTINILDGAGKVVFTNRAAYASSTLNIGNLASGMYVVKVYGDKKETYTQQFVK